MPPITIRLNPNDTVVVARVDLMAGTDIPGENFNGEGIKAAGFVPAGHKLAVKPVAVGEPIRKYGQIIGFATQAITVGEHIHTHNCAIGSFDRDYAFGADAHPTDFVPADAQATFQGIVRPDGRVATRNYLGVVTSVNCSAHVARRIVALLDQEIRQNWPGVDGAVAITHGTGCGMAASGEPVDLLRRTLAGYARHPNFAGVLLLGLGCEANQIAGMVQSGGLKTGALLETMTIQESGGTTKTIEGGLDRLKAMLPEAAKAKRMPVPASHLTLALQCGGSDGYSGITANPALGAAVDLLVRHGGTAVLSETPEIYGAEHLLTRRAQTREVGEKLVERIKWWEDYTATNKGSMDNNPSPGNKAGGLTTILEKSLGAVAKGGSTNLTDVYRYADPITAKGFVFMDTPGYDPVSATGQVAGGANMICFTTGRGSVFGCKPTPSLKLATNSALYRRMTDDMDINCGPITDGDVTVAEMGQRIFEHVLKAASGEPTKSEALGFGDDEFQPWQLGAVM